MRDPQPTARALWANARTAAASAATVATARARPDSGLQEGERTFQRAGRAAAILAGPCPCNRMGDLLHVQGCRDNSAMARPVAVGCHQFFQVVGHRPLRTISPTSSP